jgi:hypothetical protein
MKSIPLSGRIFSIATGNNDFKNDDDTRAYIPGVCNIGKDEIRKRRNGFYGALAFLVILVVMLEFLNAGRGWRLIIFIPLFIATVSYLQWHYKFCAGFGLKGVFNFGDLGKTFNVDQKENFRKDRMKAWDMIIKSALIALIFSAIWYFI